MGGFFCEVAARLVKAKSRCRKWEPKREVQGWRQLLKSLPNTHIPLRFRHEWSQTVASTHPATAPLHTLGCKQHTITMPSASWQRRGADGWGWGGPTVAENHSHQQQRRPITKLSATLRPLLDPSRGLPARLSSIPLLVCSPHSSLTPLLLPLLLFLSAPALHSLPLAAAASFACLYLSRLCPLSQ